MIDVERRAGGAWVTLNRPAVLNALDPAMVEALDAAFDELQQDAVVRAVAITGAGRAFCAGADLEFAAGDEAQAGVDRFILELGRLFTRIERFPKPTIAAVNGIAAGGGFELILCCDLVIAASTARIGDSHANFGLVPGGGASARLPRKVTANVAKQLLFTGDLLPVAELARIGLVNQVSEDLAGDVDALMVY
jgi:enoyl-CoA hydratase